jgi:hypothetical protein
MDLISEVPMPRPSHKTILYAAAGGLGGSAAWIFVLSASTAAGGNLLSEMLLGALMGLFIGGFIWCHEAVGGRQFLAALKRAGYGAAAGVIGGGTGALLGNTVFSLLGAFVAGLGGLRASVGIAVSVALGWAVLGAVVGFSGGMMIRSRERALYGLSGGALGGALGGLLFYSLSATSIWSALAGLRCLVCPSARSSALSRRPLSPQR